MNSRATLFNKETNSCEPVWLSGMRASHASRGSEVRILHHDRNFLAEKLLCSTGRNHWKLRYGRTNPSPQHYFQAFRIPKRRWAPRHHTLLCDVRSIDFFDFWIRCLVSFLIKVSFSVRYLIEIGTSDFKKDWLLTEIGSIFKASAKSKRVRE